MAYLANIFKDHIGCLLTNHVDGDYDKETGNARKDRRIHDAQVAHTTNTKTRI